MPGGCPERAPSSCDHVQSPGPHSAAVTKCPVHADQVPAVPELMPRGRSPVPVSYKTTDGDGGREGREDWDPVCSIREHVHLHRTAEGSEPRSWHQILTDVNLSPFLPSCVALGKLVDLSGLPFPSL